ncbi:MAG TPA: hypothetical protein ENJ08_11410 [Gammaproteobacteria bacterium]|nr:hypothetical protein [Gammaproteobacteria bacterium]
MQTRQKLLSSITLMACSGLSLQTHAALAPNAVLNFIPGVATTSVSSTVRVKSGSYFGMDRSGNSKISTSERTALSPNDGLIIGQSQFASGSHTGPPNGSESPGLDQAWAFVGNTGLDYTRSPVNILSDDGNGIVTLDFIGWTVTWNGVPTIPINGDASWQPGFADAVAKLTCGTDCADGDSFTLDYYSTVPADCGGCGFENVRYQLFLTGTISVPNTPPTASDTSISELPAASYTWTPVVSDPESPPQTLSCSIVNDGSSGTATVQLDCSSGDYTPAAGAGFTGTDSFTYKVNDGVVDSTNATVNVNIAADPSPVCNIIAITGVTGVPSVIPLDIANNCTDAGGTAIVPTSVTVTTPSTNSGTAVVDSATQIATYTPAFGFSGVDTFTYTVSDGNSASVPANINITVNASTPASSDGSFSCGSTAIAAGSTDCVISETDIGVADNGSSAQQGIAQSCIGGCFDFEITGFTGTTAQIVLPLNIAIPPAATAGNSLIYRKLKSTGWVSFDASGNDEVASAPGIGSGASTVCPPASSTNYASGIIEGNRCLRLTIVDNGPNDNNAATGTIADPGGIGESFFIDTRTSGSNGCSLSETPVAASQRADWWLVAGFMGLLGLFRLKRNNKKA